MNKEQKISVIKEVLECFGKGDYHGMLKWVAKDVRWVVPGPPDDPFAGEYSDLEHVSDGFTTFLSTIGAIEHYTPEEIIVDGDAAAVLGHTKIRFKASKQSVGIRFAYVMKFHDDKIVEFTAFRHHIERK